MSVFVYWHRLKNNWLVLHMLYVMAGKLSVSITSKGISYAKVSFSVGG